MSAPNLQDALWLTLDRGNTFTKAVLWQDNELKEKFKCEDSELQALAAFINRYQPKAGIVCSVREEDPVFAERLAWETGCPLMELNAVLPLPVEVEYDRSTLGTDRIAAVVGARQIADGRAALAIDCGTAMTIDFIDSKGVYKGGNISPGMSLRFKSLYEATARLPLVSHGELSEPFGHTTEEAIRNGVMLGMVYEIEGASKDAGDMEQNTLVVLTGGDSPALFPLLRQRGVEVVYEPELVAKGLLKILEYNTR